MHRLIYYFVSLIIRLHNKFLSINDNHNLALNDKQLHFIIIGLFGFGMLCVIQPLFEWLNKHDLTLFITFTYVFSAVLVISFAIEIGQAYSGTGDMDFYDVVYGILGFFAFFFIYLIIYLLYRYIKKKVYLKNNKLTDNIIEDDTKTNM